MRKLSLSLRVLLVLTLALVSGHQAVGRALATGAVFVELCRDGSLVTVTLDARGNPVSHDHACPDCVLSGLAIGSDGPLVAPPLARARPMVATFRAGAVHGRAVPLALARGPPGARA